MTRLHRCSSKRKKPRKIRMVRPKFPGRISKPALKLNPPRRIKQKGEPKSMANGKKSTKEIKLAIMDLRNQIPKEEKEIAGVKVWVHGLTSYELEEWRMLRNNPEGTDANLSTAKLLQLALRDETGAKIFTAKELAIIAGLPAKDIEPLSRVALRLSGYGVEAEAAIVKNLLRTPGGDGSSEQQESTDAPSPSS